MFLWFALCRGWSLCSLVKVPVFPCNCSCKVESVDRHYITSNYITLYFVKLRYIKLHYSTLNYIKLFYITGWNQLTAITLHRALWWLYCVKLDSDIETGIPVRRQNWSKIWNTTNFRANYYYYWGMEQVSILIWAPSNLSIDWDLVSKTHACVFFLCYNCSVGRVGRDGMPQSVTQKESIRHLLLATKS